MPATTAKAKSPKIKSTATRTAEVLFAPAAIQRLEAQATLPAKFLRMLDQYPMKRICEGGTVAVKIHVGGGYGFTTIPPLFLRLLVQKIKDAGAKSVFITDGSGAIGRGRRPRLHRRGAGRAARRRGRHQGQVLLQAQGPLQERSRNWRSAATSRMPMP